MSALIWSILAPILDLVQAPVQFFAMVARQPEPCASVLFWGRYGEVNKGYCSFCDSSLFDYTFDLNQ
jgi:hypothetical protein